MQYVHTIVTPKIALKHTEELSVLLEEALKLKLNTSKIKHYADSVNRNTRFRVSRSATHDGAITKSNSHNECGIK